jgi:hypothetical protein
MKAETILPTDADFARLYQAIEARREHARHEFAAAATLFAERLMHNLSAKYDMRYERVGFDPPLHHVMTTIAPVSRSMDAHDHVTSEFHVIFFQGREAGREERYKFNLKVWGGNRDASIVDEGFREVGFELKHVQKTRDGTWRRPLDQGETIRPIFVEISRAPAREFPMEDLMAYAQSAISDIVTSLTEAHLPGRKFFTPRAAAALART